MTDENTEREVFKKRLMVLTGLPLDPTPATQIERDFDSDSIIVDYYPIQSIRNIMIDKNCICINECMIDKSAGIIFLPKNYTGTLKIQYMYCIPETEYEAIIDLMVEYENTPGWDKRASSITEGGVTVSIDTSVGKGALIQSMIDDLKLRYNSTARLI